jgi:hypothetical protein
MWQLGQNKDSWRQITAIKVAFTAIKVAFSKFDPHKHWACGPSKYLNILNTLNTRARETP